ncbi:MAG: thiamine phosphate synthase [Neisseriaceae bacterium]
MNSKNLKLYFVMGSADVQGDPVALLDRVLQLGISCFQWREKGPRALKGEDYFRFAKLCQQLCRRFQVPFIVNDDVELALELQAEGIHIGVTDAPLALVKSKVLSSMWVGYSVNAAQDLEVALQVGANYVGVGPIFPTTSKADAAPPLGLKELGRLRRLAPTLPMVAIGGIDETNFKKVLHCGVEGAAFISAICKYPSFVTRYLKYYNSMPNNFY